MNLTFANPFLVIKCENCDFIAKTNEGLQVHIRAKHKEMLNKSDSATNAFEEGLRA